MQECEAAYGECTPDFKTKRELMLHQKMMEYLDAGYGQCLLRDPDVRFILERAFEHMNHTTVLVHAYVIMPNHVHAILETLGDGIGIQQVMHSLKGFIASSINKHLLRQGSVWQREYYDRIIRNRRHYVSAVHYILRNPRFCHDGEYSLGGQAFQPAEDDE